MESYEIYKRYIMTEPGRVTPEEVHQKLKSGNILLVCAYEDEEKFRQLQLEGGISLKEFKSRLPSLGNDREIVFYWGWPKEASAAGQAAKFIEMGYKNVKVLGGGVLAWKDAGYSIIKSE